MAAKLLFQDNIESSLFWPDGNIVLHIQGLLVGRHWFYLLNDKYLVADIKRGNRSEGYLCAHL